MGHLDQTERLRDEATALLNLARDDRRKDPRRSEEVAQRSYAVFESISDTAGMCDATILVAWCRCDLADHARSYESCRKAIELATSLDDLDRIATSYLHYGLTALCADDTIDAVEYFETSIEMAVRTANEMVRWRALANLSLAYGHLGLFDKAIGTTITAIHLAHMLEAPVGIGPATFNLSRFLIAKGVASGQQGDLESRKLCCESALRILDCGIDEFEESASSEDLILPYTLQIKALLITGQNGQIGAVTKKLRKCLREISHPYKLAPFYETAGFRCRHRGRLHSAMKWLLLAVRQYECLGEFKVVRWILMDISEIASEVGQFEVAFNALNRIRMIENHESMVGMSNRSHASQLKLEFEKARFENGLLRERNALLVVQTTDLAWKSRTDGLTGVLNRSALFDDLENVLPQDRPRGVAMIDVDHFKDVNDKYGHLVGDKVLKELASILLATTELRAYVGRYGGEEFVIADVDQPIVENVVERIRSEVESHNWDAIAPGLLLTVSIGMSRLENRMTVEEALHRADVNLYQAKRSGRNRIVWDDTGLLNAA